VTALKVVVVGAGHSGLATAAALRRSGVAALAIDRADALGASWRARYDRLKLNTSRWTSQLPNAPYPKGTPLYPMRDEMVAYLERFAADNELEVKLGTSVHRIDRDDGTWLVRTSAGDFAAPQVVVTTGFENTPAIPDWPGGDRFAGQLLHAALYRNAEPFRAKDVLVVGPGCSGMEIAYDLVEGGARNVSIAVRTPPNIVLREPGFPADLPPQLLMKLPPRLADGVMKMMRGRMIGGDLSAYGLPWPEEGIFTRLRREGKAPAIVDKEVIEAIKERRIEIVAGLESLDERAVLLSDGTRLEPDAVIAATGYSRGLEPLVGHLDVLDEHGVPRKHGADAAAPGLRFVGYLPRPGQIGATGRQATRAARAIALELRAASAHA
jgi:NADPH-dependent 2,4-dienoyl-CoA reductase/sulfur reductase-like enzyme